MRIDVYHHSGVHERTLERLATLVAHLTKKVLEMSAQLDALTAAVAANTTVTGSAIELLNGLHAKIVELLAQETIDPVAVQALADELSAKTQALADAVTANTPV
jgi:translation initiation factor 1 (eIF-1/SUI1)